MKNIDGTINICRTDIYTPAIFKLFYSKHIEGNDEKELYKFTNSFNGNEEYYKRNSNIKKADSEYYNNHISN